MSNVGKIGWENIRPRPGAFARVLEEGCLSHDLIEEH